MTIKSIILLGFSTEQFSKIKLKETYNMGNGERTSGSLYLIILSFVIVVYFLNIALMQ